MTKNSFRTLTPKRTYLGEQLLYTKYKPQLQKDFNNRCGYTDCQDMWFGKTSYQIDHFAPFSKFPKLRDEYGNLVYVCSFVNRAKWNDWVTDDATTPIANDEGYLDPCNDDFNKHFYRDNSGAIHPEDGSPVAKYMYKRLKLHLKRYSIIWQIEQVKERMDRIRSLVKQGKVSSTETAELFGELYDEYDKYFKNLQGEI